MTTTLEQLEEESLKLRSALQNLIEAHREVFKERISICFVVGGNPAFQKAWVAAENALLLPYTDQLAKQREADLEIINLAIEQEHHPDCDILFISAFNPNHKCDCRLGQALAKRELVYKSYERMK